jgi:NAD-dependent SIR2 family protein deacetylase
MIAFTGAGISTSTGIPDFRSGKDTVLPTGPGAWEKAALKLNTKAKLSVPTVKAKPSVTHMSLVTLQQYGVLKYLVSQNTDGLHLRSGFPSDFISELHGNTNL